MHFLVVFLIVLAAGAWALFLINVVLGIPFGLVWMIFIGLFALLLVKITYENFSQKTS